MERKKDLRVIKTNRNIINAFIELLGEKDFHSITVQDILERALINRSTFYKHYSDKFELAETVAKNFLDEFESVMRIKYSEREDFDLFMNKWDKMFENFVERRMLITGLWKIRTENINVYEDMNAILKQQYIVFANDSIGEGINLNYHATLFAAITLATLEFMMESKKPFSARELIKELQVFYNTIHIPMLKKIEQ